MVLVSISRVSRDWQRTVSRPTMQRFSLSLGRLGCVMMASLCTVGQGLSSSAKAFRHHSSCRTMASMQIHKQEEMSRTPLPGVSILKLV